MSTSDSYHVAVMKQDNGELQEDVVSRQVAEGDGDGDDGNEEDAGVMGVAAAAGSSVVEHQSAQSFPASDPPSSWAGPPEGPGEPGTAPTGSAGAGVPAGDRAEGSADSSGRVVGSEPVSEVPGRRHRADPVPGTLPGRRR